MLVLKRIIRFNEVIRDTVDNRMITYGEYYYEDVDINTNEFLGTRISVVSNGFFDMSVPI